MKVYPDHANWIGLARGTEDQSAFEELIVAGFVAVLSFAQVLELANTPEAAAAGTAKYMDHIAGIGGIRWIRGLRQVRKEEALAAFELWHTGKKVAVEPFTPSFSDALAGRISWPNIEETRAYSVERISNLLRENEALPEHKQLRKNYPQMQRAVGAIRRGRRQVRFTEAEKRSWIASEVPDRIILRSGIVISVTAQMRAEFTATVDISLCPATLATLAIYEGRNVADGSGKPSDVEDILHVVGLVYCDVAFADRQTYHVLSTGGFSPLPKRNSEFGAWLQNEKQRLQ